MSILVSPSTTQIQINPLESPYTSVLLNQIQYPGQVITILDGTSSFGATQTPIVVSTGTTNSFLDGSISTLINQPQGFITAQTTTTNKWAFLNSFPFRNQYFSAGLLNLTTSSLFTALTSTVSEYVDSLTVENLTVTGNFLQSQGITLNTNVSSLGTVEILSSLNVWGNTYLSSSMSTFSALNLYSSLLVGSDFTTANSLQTQSSFYVSSSLTAIGLLSTQSIQLQDGLVGTTLNVSTNQFTFANIAGSLLVENTVSTVSSVFLGGFLAASNTQAGSAIFLSSATLFQTADIHTFLSTQQTFSTTGSLGVGLGLTVGLDLTTGGTVSIYGDGTIQDLLTVQSTLVTSTMRVGLLEVQGDYTNSSTITNASLLSVNSNMGAGSLSSGSTFINGSLKIYENFAAGDIAIQSYLDILGGISSLGNVSSGQQFLLEGSLSSFGATKVSSMSISGSVSVDASTITSLFGQSTTIQGNLFGLGNLDCTGTLTISSISLLSSLVANTFVAGNAIVGTYGIFNEMNLGTFVASSVTFGYIEQSSYPVDISGSFFLNSTSIFAPPLSTSLLSTASYTVPNLSSSYIRVESAMAVNTPLVANTFVCEPLGYFLSSPVLVQSTLSTGYVLTNVIDGSMIGDGSQLSNYSYPKQIIVDEVLVNGELMINPLAPVGIVTSTLQVEEATFRTAFVNSTINIGSFEIRGTQLNIDYGLTTNTLQPSTNLLFLNNVQFVGNGANTVARRVGIHENAMINPYNSTLGVFSTLAFDTIQSDFVLDITTFNANKVIVAEDVTGLNGGTGTIYLSSGTISTLSRPFFLGEDQQYDSQVNIIQPYQTTLGFNSTLFVRRDWNSVGINTQPNFMLDAESIFINLTTTASNAIAIQNDVVLQPNLSTLYYSFADINPNYSITLFTNSINEPWTNFFFFNPSFVFKAGFSPGLSRLSNSFLDGNAAYEKYLPQYFLGTQTFNGSPPYGLIGYMVSLGNYFDILSAGFSENPPEVFHGMATNGDLTIACGRIEPQWQNINTNTLFYRTGDNFQTFTFNSINSLIFPPWSLPTSYTRGGYDIVYGGINAPIWITVGTGSDGAIWRSQDGYTWSVVDIGQYELYSIVSTELPYNGGTVFLTGGAYLFSAGNTFIPMNGFVFASIDLGVTWTLAGSNFTGPVKEIATDGKVAVAAVNATVASNTLLYSYLTSSNTYNWQPCFGDTFLTRANSVIWTGSEFVAGGDSGIRTSLNGITWTNPGTLFQEVNNLAYTSNAATMMRFKRSFPEQRLFFQDSANLQCQRLISATTISYYSNGVLNLNNACILDESANIISFGSLNTPSPLQGSGFQSTFYASDAYISSFVSTASLTLGAYRLQIQSV